MLIVENYTAGYANNQYLFHEMSFKLKPHEIIGIRGINGCGKSTFIKGLINLTPIKKGKIFMDNDNISYWNTSQIFKLKSIGYLSQRERIFNHLTVWENIKLYSYYSKRGGIIETDFYEKMLSVINDKKNIPAANLSGGEQLILNLLCITILNPNTILLDEPSDSLDTKFKELLIQILLYWKKTKSILIVEQNLDILENVSTRIYDI